MVCIISSNVLKIQIIHIIGILARSYIIKRIVISKTPSILSIIYERNNGNSKLHLFEDLIDIVLANIIRTYYRC